MTNVYLCSVKIGIYLCKMKIITRFFVALRIMMGSDRNGRNSDRAGIEGVLRLATQVFRATVRIHRICQINDFNATRIKWIVRVARVFGQYGFVLETVTFSFCCILSTNGIEHTANERIGRVQSPRNPIKYFITRVASCGITERVKVARNSHGLVFSSLTETRGRKWDFRVRRMAINELRGFWSFGDSSDTFGRNRIFMEQLGLLENFRIV